MPKRVSPEVEDTDPAVRVVAFNTPCFIFSKTKSFKGMLGNIALAHKLTSEKDDEALATLQSQGFFLPLTAGVHVSGGIDISVCA